MILYLVPAGDMRVAQSLDQTIFPQFPGDPQTSQVLNGLPFCGKDASANGVILMVHIEAQAGEHTRLSSEGANCLTNRMIHLGIRGGKRECPWTTGAYPVGYGAFCVFCSCRQDLEALRAGISYRPVSRARIVSTLGETTA
jgi:hypothetical protein